jgi:hypothetical protein
MSLHTCECYRTTKSKHKNPCGASALEKKNTVVGWIWVCDSCMRDCWYVGDKQL